MRSFKLMTSDGKVHFQKGFELVIQQVHKNSEPNHITTI